MRKTYFDNNGYERFEDTCKIVPNGNHFYTDKMIAEETKDWNFKKPVNSYNNNSDYESRLLAQGETDGD